MIRIGFDDSDPEALRAALADKKEGPKFEGGDRSKDVYIPERFIEKLKVEYSEVTVHDFGDDYHLSEEERERHNKYYKAFKELNRTKKKIRKLKDYIEVMRLALHCLDLVAQDNKMYDPEEFKLMVLKGKIYVNGLTFPKYIGKNRKSLSKDYLSEFILSGKPYEEYMGDDNDDEYLSDEELLEQEEELFDMPDQKASKPSEEIRDSFFDAKTEVQPDNATLHLTPKQTRKLIKVNPSLIGVIKDIKKNRNNEELMRDISHGDAVSADFEDIERYDSKRNYVTDSEMPEFIGDLMNDDDYNRYLYELEEWMDTHTKTRVDGKMKTPEEAKLIQLKDALEAAGWDIRNLYDNKEKVKALERALKRDEKKEKKVKKRLLRIQDRRARRMGESPKKRKKTKKKKKDKDNDHHRNNEYKDGYKAEAMEATEQLLLNAVQRGNDEFDAYEEDTMDWSWDTIMKGN